MTGHVELEFLNRHCVYVRGYAGREALIAVTSKAPVWSSTAKAWVCSERTARHRLLPHLEHLGIDVVVTGTRGGVVG